MRQETVLITGASRGIGAEAARQFARAGYAVAIHYNKSRTQAESLAAELTAAGHTVIAVQGDVSRPEEARRIVDNVLDKFCQLDILICNAGIADVQMLGDVTTERWREIFAVNVDGAFYCIKAALPQFIHHKAGRIITVSSMWGQTGGSCEVAYSASKAAVIGLTKALAKELGPSGITVNCVSPGVIDTEMNALLSPESLAELAQETPLGRIGTAADVAGVMLFLASPPAAFLTGQLLAPNGGLVI